MEISRYIHEVTPSPPHTPWRGFSHDAVSEILRYCKRRIKDKTFYKINEKYTGRIKANWGNWTCSFQTSIKNKIETSKTTNTYFPCVALKNKPACSIFWIAGWLLVVCFPQFVSIRPECMPRWFFFKNCACSTALSSCQC